MPNRIATRAFFNGLPGRKKKAAARGGSLACGFWRRCAGGSHPRISSRDPSAEPGLRPASPMPANGPANGLLRVGSGDRLPVAHRAIGIGQRRHARPGLPHRAAGRHHRRGRSALDLRRRLGNLVRRTGGLGRITAARRGLLAACRLSASGLAASSLTTGRLAARLLAARLLAAVLMS